jgi:DNA-directed RNA polymerase specialized sigma24 family protein
MSRPETAGDAPGPHGHDGEKGRLEARNAERLDFEAARDADTTSWQRADPQRALIERWGRYGYLVTLPDGDAHFCAIGRRDGELRGFCKCKGFRHHAGPCAHLCTIRKAAWANQNLAETIEAANGEPIEIAPMVEDQPDLIDEEHTAAQVAGEVFEDEASTVDGPGWDELTDDEREVYKLVEADGLEPADAAAETGRSASCARTLLQRAREKVDQEADA